MWPGTSEFHSSQMISLFLLSISFIPNMYWELLTRSPTLRIYWVMSISIVFISLSREVSDSNNGLSTPFVNISWIPLRFMPFRLIPIWQSFICRSRGQRLSSSNVGDSKSEMQSNPKTGNFENFGSNVIYSPIWAMSFDWFSTNKSSMFFFSLGSAWLKSWLIWIFYCSIKKLL